jgi:hypothetical protein
MFMIHIAESFFHSCYTTALLVLILFCIGCSGSTPRIRPPMYPVVAVTIMIRLPCCSQTDKELEWTVATTVSFVLP